LRVASSGCALGLAVGVPVLDALGLGAAVCFEPPEQAANATPAMTSPIPHIRRAGRCATGPGCRNGGVATIPAVPTLRAVLFDLGGVVFDSPLDGFTRYESEVGLPVDFIRTLNSTNSDANAWARLERGELTRDEFIAAFEAEALAAGQRLEGLRVLEALKGDVRPVMVEAVRRLKAAAFMTAAVTNNIAPMDSVERDVSGVMALFDVVIESSVVGVRKPEEAFYRIALDKLGVTADECVYLDDLGVNLKPARAMGMTTIKVLDADSAVAELEDHVGIPLS
jgi:putative hydrolase of the HAD superfamily